MPIVNAKKLLEAGAHFGHSASRWNPKMEPYILTKRNGIHIINLRETVKGVVAAYYFIRKVASEGRMVLFVGTKRQAQEAIAAQAKRCEMPYVVERWLGGTLTNLQTIITRVRRLIELEQMEESGETNSLSKKRHSAVNRERRKIKRNLDGIRDMDRLPGALFIVDPKYDHNAVSEARILGIPVVAILDTDSDPDPLDLPIPANDDAVRAIDLIGGRIADAVIEGVQFRQAHPEIAKQEEVVRRKRYEDRQAIGAVSVGGGRR